MLEEPENKDNSARAVPAVKAAVLGVGSSGILMMKSMALPRIPIARIFMDTYRGAFDDIPAGAGTKVLLGEKELRGLGTGMDAGAAERAAEASGGDIAAALRGYDLLFVVVALGHGTGSGATAFIVKTARELGITTICFATFPFTREGAAIGERAAVAAKKISEESNAFVAIEDDFVAQVDGAGINYVDGYKIARSWIERGIEACCAIIFNSDAETKIDLSTFRRMFPMTGAPTLFTIGEGRGQAAFEMAFDELGKNPLLRTAFSTSRADTLIFHMQVGATPSLATVNDISERIQKRFGGRDCNMPAFTVVPELGDSVRICLIGAGGLESTRKKKDKISEPPRGRNAIAAPAEEELFPASEVEVMQRNGELIDESTIGHLHYYDGVNLDKPTYLRRGKNPEDELKKRKRQSS